MGRRSRGTLGLRVRRGMRGWVVGLAGLVGIVSLQGRGAAAAELTAPEKAWAKVCAENLASDSEKVRNGAATALGQLGTDALATVLGNLSRLKKDEHWDALEKACDGMGREKAATALEYLVGSWPKPQAPRVEALVKRLKEKKENVELDKLASAGAVGTVVKKVLDGYAKSSSFGNMDKEMDRLLALGHAAVPFLLEELRNDASSEGISKRGMAPAAAAAALAGLVVEADIPAIAEVLLLGGNMRAAEALSKLKTGAALDALLAPLEKGFLSHSLAEALQAHGRSPKTIAALGTWLETYGTQGAKEAGEAADVLAELGDPAAIPALLRVSGASLTDDNLAPVAVALVRLGEAKGFPLCLTVLERVPEEGEKNDPDKFFAAFAKKQVGEALNRVCGERIYVDDGTFRANKTDWKAVGAKFRAWWEPRKDKLTFDPKTKRWSAPEPKPGK